MSESTVVTCHKCLGREWLRIADKAELECASCGARVPYAQVVSGQWDCTVADCWCQE